MALDSRANIFPKMQLIPLPLKMVDFRDEDPESFSTDPDPAQLKKIPDPTPNAT